MIYLVLDQSLTDHSGQVAAGRVSHENQTVQVDVKATMVSDQIQSGVVGVVERGREFMLRNEPKLNVDHREVGVLGHQVGHGLHGVRRANEESTAVIEQDGGRNVLRRILVRFAVLVGRVVRPIDAQVHARALVLDQLVHDLDSVRRIANIESADRHVIGKPGDVDPMNKAD